MESEKKIRMVGAGWALGGGLVVVRVLLVCGGGICWCG